MEKQISNYLSNITKVQTYKNLKTQLQKNRFIEYYKIIRSSRGKS